MLRMRMLVMGAGDGFVVVGEEVVVVIVIVVDEMVVSDVFFARATCDERTCVVVLRGGGHPVVERVVGKIDLDCGVREEKFVGILFGTW